MMATSLDIFRGSSYEVPSQQPGLPPLPLPMRPFNMSRAHALLLIAIADEAAPHFKSDADAGALEHFEALHRAGIKPMMQIRDNPQT